MRAITVFLIIILICSCNKVDNESENSDTTMTRHDKVFKILEDYNIREMEDDFSKYPQARKHFDKAKPLHIQVTPMLIGPLTKGQVEYKLNKITGKSPGKDVPKSSFNYENDRWNEVLSKYQDGDEFYYYKIDTRDYIPFSGMIEVFILIRDNEFIGEIPIAIMIQ